MTDENLVDIGSDSFLDKMAETIRRSKGIGLKKSDLNESQVLEQRQIARKYLMDMFPKFAERIGKDNSKSNRCK